MIRSRLTRRRRGTAAVELAVILAFVLAPLLVGTWEMARVAEFQSLASNAAREGARRASSGQANTQETAAVVIDYLRNAGLPHATAQVRIENVTTGNTVTYNATGGTMSGSDFGLTNSSQNDQLRLTVSIPFNDIKWAALTRIWASGTLVGQTNWHSLRDRDFPSLNDPPIE